VGYSLRHQNRSVEFAPVDSPFPPFPSILLFPLALFSFRNWIKSSLEPMTTGYPPFSDFPSSGNPSHGLRGFAPSPMPASWILPCTPPGSYCFVLLRGFDFFEAAGAIINIPLISTSALQLSVSPSTLRDQWPESWR